MLVKSIMTSDVKSCAPDASLAGIVSIDDLVLRPRSHAGAAVSDQDVLDAFEAICAHAVAA